MGRRASGLGALTLPRAWLALARARGRVKSREALIEDIRDRMLFAEALETAKTFEEGVITSAAAANIGSIMGIGFPPWTGGVLQFINSTGLAVFVARARELAALPHVAIVCGHYEGLDQRGQATLVVSGGSTPVPFFQALRELELDPQEKKEFDASVEHVRTLISQIQL